LKFLATLLALSVLTACGGGADELDEEPRSVIPISCKDETGHPIHNLCA